MQSTLASSDYHNLVQRIDSAPVKVNWEDIINDLTAQGISPHMQADIINRPNSTLNRWRNGAEPRFENGMVMLLLHQLVCGPVATLARFSIEDE